MSNKKLFRLGELFRFDDIYCHETIRVLLSNVFWLHCGSSMARSNLKYVDASQVKKGFWQEAPSFFGKQQVTWYCDSCAQKLKSKL